MNSFILSILFNICISILIIYLFHQLWEHLKNQYSIKKTVDKFNFQNDKYDKIIHKLQNEEIINKTVNMQRVEDNDFEKLNQELLDFSEQNC
jgi:FtsZ-interacting cell division protein ZipA|uniref:Uncharacterized protein n=1 Tax=viral metagenome TaxID=1070528 RepID=A0A6C0F8N8_9ZZZZ|tara:strand:+ start:8954 stop:9229 length:276 start_codon:yes stop_codon:yes gene_type:complete